MSIPPDARTVLLQAIQMAKGSGLDYIGGEMLGVRRKAVVSMDFGAERHSDGVIGTYESVETDADYRARVLARYEYTQFPMRLEHIALTDRGLELCLPAKAAPARPDGFDQAQVDAAKAILLATKRCPA